MLTIRTNNQYRTALYGYELPEKIKSDFDYIDDLESETFIKYKGQYYWINDFITTSSMSDENPLKQWDGYINNSAFDGLLIKCDNNDHDTFLIGQYFS